MTLSPDLIAFLKAWHGKPDPLTEAYLEQPSDWWAVPLAFVFGALSVVVLVGAVS